MDEYWYYSLFTLAMLVVFESTVVMSRQRNLQDLRRLKPPMMSLMVHRAGRWGRLTNSCYILLANSWQTPGRFLANNSWQNTSRI